MFQRKKKKASELQLVRGAKPSPDTQLGVEGERKCQEAAAWVWKVGVA
jgi:hypothetical protein